MASELILAWRSDSPETSNTEPTGSLLFPRTRWLASFAKFYAIVIPRSSQQVDKAIIFRFTIPIALAVTHMRPVQDPVAANISHNAYISAIGFAQLDAIIPREAIVPANHCKSQRIPGR